MLTSPGFGVWLEPATKVAGLIVENTGGIGIVGLTITSDVTIDMVWVNGSGIGVSCIMFSGVDGNVTGSDLSLANCGTNGMTIVNGDGSTPGSGGTIQNTANQPFLLDNANSVSLQSMNIIAGTDPAGNGQAAIFAMNNSAVVVGQSTVTGGNGTTGGGGTGIFCDASVWNVFGSLVQGGNGGVGAIGFSGGPGVHAMNDSYVQLGYGAEIRGGNGADNAVPGAGADGILAQNANVLANDSLIAGGNGAAGGGVFGGASGTAVDVDIVGGAHDVRLGTSALESGVNGVGGFGYGLFVETSGGSVCVRASGNTGLGSYRLNNFGGTLGITQAGIGDLVTENNFVSVGTLGVITFNC